MGISIESYRIRIGTFVPKEPKSFKIKRYKFSSNSCNIKYKLKKTTIREVFISCMVWIMIYSSMTIWNTSNVQSQLLRSNRIIEPGCDNVQSFSNQWGAGLSWSYSRSKVNLMHYTNGNRRNLGYRYFSWNCDRGLLSKNKIEDIRVFASKHSPHLIAISEVDLRKNEQNVNDRSTNEFSTEQVHDIFKIQGYNIILPSSWDIHGKARIMVFASEEVKVKLIKPHNDETHIQNVILEVGFGRAKTHLVSFYYREWKSCITNNDSAEYQHQYLSSLINIWRRCTSEDKEFVALGDMNLCAKKMKEPGFIHSDLSDIVNDFNIEEDCHQLIDTFTRIRNVNGSVQRSCLDHVTVNCISKMTRPEIHGVGQSDHLGVMVTKHTNELRKAARTTKKRVYKDFVEKDFIEDIRKAKADGLFEELFDTDDIEKAGDIFTEVFRNILDKHAPIKVIQNRKNYVPYISKELKVIMKARDDLKVIAATTGETEDFEKYKHKRNEVSTKLKTAKSDYFHSKFSQENQSSGDVWKTAFTILGKNKSEFPSQILIGRNLCSTPSIIAEEMNNFFIRKIARLKENAPVVSDESLIELKRFLASKELPGEGFSLREISLEESSKILKGLKGKKSCGLDWICGYSLKLVSKDLNPEIARLINISIRTGRFYSQWKLSKVLPGYKNKGSKFDAAFYRPISNLSEVSKAAEKAVHQQVYEYLNHHGLIHPDHHGFLQNHSTATALQQLVDTWLRAADEGKLSASILLDLRAGFDVINHELLIRKLAEYRFNDIAISWFTQYLDGRQQCVQVESSFSPFLSVPWGVPQGSILGPLLFLIFINELPDTVKHTGENDESSVIVFADDNSPTTTHENPIRLQENIQRDTNIVTDWFAKNDISCSAEKTKLLFVGTRAKRVSKIVSKGFAPRIDVCSDSIDESTSEKILGVTVNNTITWKEHLYGDSDNEGLVPCLSKRIGVLKRIRKYVPKRKFTQIVSGLFTSKLSYCSNVWGGLWDIPGTMDDSIRTSITKTDMRRLQVLQNKTMRLETNLDYRTPTSQLLKQTGRLSVHQMVASSTAVQVYKIKTSQQPRYHHERQFSQQ